MKRIIKKLALFLIFALMFSVIQPDSVLAAPKKYVKKLSVSQKTVKIFVGKSKSIPYKVKVKGKASKKISVKTSNKKVKAVVKKSKIKISAKKAGNCKLIILTKGKGRKGERIRKTIKIKIIKNTLSVKKPISKETPKEETPSPSPSPTPSPVKREVTRAEWISKVMMITKHSVQKELFEYDKSGNIIYSFNDISDNMNADIIETAARYGITPESTGKFRPDDPADREFLAVTSVRAIGLTTNDLKADYGDQIDLVYDMEDEVAVQLELLELINDRFFPAKNVTEAEVKRAEKILLDIMEDREIDEKHKDVIEYNEEVKNEKEVSDYTVREEDGTYIIEIPEGMSIDDVSRGDKIVLPSTDSYPEGIALDVESNTFSSDEGCWMVEGTTPEEVMDFVDTVDIEGKAEADLENITAVDGVATVEIIKSGKEKDTGNTVKKKKMSGVNIEGAVDVKDRTKISYTIDEIETTVSFYLSELKYSIDFDKKGVNKIYIGLPNVLLMETDYKAGKNFSKKIGEIPIELGAGFSANIEVFLEAGISGEIKMNLKLSNNIGMQYLNGQFYLEKSCQPSFDMAVDADLDAGTRLQLGLYWMKGIKEIFGKDDPKPMYNVSTKWGMHGDAILHIRNDQYTSYENLMCVDLGYYLYGNVSIGEGSFLGDKFNLKKTWVIFNDENSPLKGVWHLENKRKVDSCTYRGNMDDDEIPGGDLLLFGDAGRFKNGNILLTDLDTWSSGSAWYQKPIATENGFVSKFSFWAGGGRDNYYGGADGIALIFSEQTGLGAAGEDLGFIGNGSYGVELDSYPRNSNDPDEKHIGIIKDQASNHLTYKLDDRVDDSQWHRLEVKYADHVLDVYLDSEFVLSTKDVILPEKVYVGISAATGDGYNRHIIKNFKVQEN